jgi:predicted nucleotidyltransferase
MTDRTATATSLVERIAARIRDAPPDARPGRAQLAEVVAQIAETFRPERIVLFGSRAYGAPTEDSDVDLLVVMETDLRQPELAARIRQSLRLDPVFPLDIIVRLPAQIRLGLEEGDFFIEDVMTLGKTLYEAGDARLD